MFQVCIAYVNKVVGGGCVVRFACGTGQDQDDGDHCCGPCYDTGRQFNCGGKKPRFKKQYVNVRQEIHRYMGPVPMKIADDSMFLQIAISVLNIRGIALDLNNMSGQAALRLVLPAGTDFGRGKIGMYKAALNFYESNENLESEE